MPADGTGTSWNETVPPDSGEKVSSGPIEIRDVRKGVRIRAEKEHTTYGNSSAGGEHKPGSAVAYYQSAAPTVRPDTTTPLSSADNGRLWIDSDTNYVYIYIDGTGWVELTRPIIRRAVFQQQVAASGTGGSSSATTWQTRVLNTSQAADTSFATVNTGTGTVTLAAGTYKISGFAVGRALGGHHLRVRQTNNTAVDLLLGTPIDLYAPTSQSTQVVQGTMLVEGIVVIASAGTTIELQHWTEQAGTNGLGVAPANSVTNVMSQLTIEKLP